MEEHRLERFSLASFDEDQHEYGEDEEYIEDETLKYHMPYSAFSALHCFATHRSYAYLRLRTARPNNKKRERWSWREERVSRVVREG